MTIHQHSVALVDALGPGVHVTHAAARKIGSAASPLAVGDALALEDGRVQVVAAIVDALDGADMTWPGATGTRAVQRVDSAADVMHARNVGPYSEQTGQPVEAKGDRGGQLVRVGEIEALLDRGAGIAAWELLTVKSDDEVGRERIWNASLVRGLPACVPFMPRATRLIERTLLALGFDVDFMKSELTIRLLDEAGIERVAPKVVTVPETFDGDGDVVPGGLFCDEAFPVGSVELARVELGAPVLHPWARDVAARLLGLTTEHLQKVLRCEATLTGGEPEGWKDTGATAVRAALARVDLAAPPGGAEEDAAAMRTSDTRPEQLCFTAWPILPADLRPITSVGRGRAIGRGLNDLYRSLVNRNKMLERCLRMGAPETVLRTETRSLQIAVDTLLDNNLEDGPVMDGDARAEPLSELSAGPDGAFLRYVTNKRVDVSAVLRVVPQADLTATRARLAREAALELFTQWVCRLLERDGHASSTTAAEQLVAARDPRAFTALAEAATNYPLIVFAERAEGAASVIAVDIELWDEAALGLGVQAVTALGLAPAANAVVHVPLDPRACHEARTRLRAGDGSPPPSPVEPRDEGWIARAARAERPGPVLLEAALRGEVDPGDGRLTRLVLARRP